MYSDKTHLGTISILINNSFFDTNSLPNWYQHFQLWFIMALMYFIPMGKHAKNTRNNVFATKLKLMDHWMAKIILASLPIEPFHKN